MSGVRSCRRVRRELWVGVILTVVLALALLVFASPAAAVTKTLHGAAYDGMKGWMQVYDKDGFAQVVDYGGLTKYRVRLAKARIVVDPSFRELAQYDPNTNTITLKRDPRKLTGKARTAFGETIWHEVTHALEDDRGDEFNDDPLHQERSIDYMTHVVRVALPWLDQMERMAKAGASVAKLKVCWDKFLREMDAAAKLDSTTKYPPDLILMRSWFGFRANPEQVRALYLSGKALPGKQGANLRKALALPPQTWTGRWETNTALGDMVLTQDGSTVNGYVANSLDPPDAFLVGGTLSADARTLTGVIDQKDPDGYDWSFVVTVGSDWRRFSGPIWVVGMENQPWTLEGSRK
jgi:hypothetical protein